MGGINSNVVLLLHGDGSDAGSVIIDGITGRTATRINTPTTVSAIKKFGQGAIRFSKLDGLSHTASYRLTSAFGIDWWVAFSVLPTTTSWQLVAGQGIPYNTSNRWYIWYYMASASMQLHLYANNPDGGSLIANASVGVFSVDTFKHLAIQRTTTSIMFFVNGVSQAVSITGTEALSLTVSAGFFLGQISGTIIYPLNEQVYDEFRIVNGVAVWTEDFTPPTEAYTMDLPVATVTFGDDGAKVEATWSGEGAAATATTTISASDNPATITLTAEGATGTTNVHNVGYAAVITMTMYATNCQPIVAYIETTLDQVTFEGDAYKVLEAELSPITLASTARTDIVGRLEEFLENIEASLHGSQEILGSINRDLRPITLSAASLYRHILGSINGTLHPIILTEQIKGIKGINCTLSVTLPNIELSATAIQNIHASLSQDLPAITAELEIESLIFEIIAMNLLNKAITNFSNYPFNSFCYFDGKYFGCARDGIYELTGVDDYGADISAHVQTGLLDLEVTLLKRVRHAYLGFKSSGQLTLTITTDDGESYSYTTEHFNGNYGGQKVKFGKGFKDRYIQLKIANTDGCTFALDKTRVFDEPISHRRR